MNNYITVTQLTRYIKYQIDNDRNLNQVYLKGEISNFKAHSKGHFYFTIKDENARINAIMFASSAKKVLFLPTDGMKILVKGRISVFEASGNYQIYVEEMLEDGLGNLHIAFEQLKEKLSKEGLFDEAHKKKVPKIPSRIGVITAPTGAAIKDILSTIKRRFPICEVILFPSLVQGENAKEDLVKNIRLADSYGLDTIILGRGGGSIEDLWAFNEEVVARAIYEAKTPIISAVGHEIDFTISDFVADLRAETPTGAAERAVPNLIDVINYINQLHIRMNQSIHNLLESYSLRLNKITESYALKNPMRIYELKEQRLDMSIDKLTTYITHLILIKMQKLKNITDKFILLNPMHACDLKSKEVKTNVEKLNHFMKNYLYKKESILDKMISKIELLNPMQSLKRGYAIVKKEDKCISNIQDLKKGDVLHILMQNGTVYTNVIEVMKDD